LELFFSFFLNLLSPPSHLFFLFFLSFFFKKFSCRSTMEETWEVDPVDLHNETIRMDLHQPEDLSSVYRILPLLRVSSASPATSPGAIPHCFATPSEGGLCVVVESQIHLFDTTYKNHLATINLGENPPHTLILSSP